MSKPVKAIYAHDHITVEAGRFVTKVEPLAVVIMATVGIHSMVRCPGCAPFVCDTRKLTTQLKKP